MHKSIFESKASEMGDFYMYYTREGRTVFTVATSDFDNKYIQNHKNFKRKPKFNPFTHALVWSWQADRLITVALSDVKKLVPLGTVLKNQRA